MTPLLEEIRTILRPDLAGESQPESLIAEHAEIPWRKVKNAVYLVRARSKDDGPWRRIGRLLAEDPDGILYIGCTDKSLLRRNQPRPCEWEKGWARWMNTWAKRDDQEPSNYPMLEGHELFLHWFELTCVGEAQRYETKAFLAYFQRFGELPPFNSQTWGTRWDAHASSPHPG